MRYLAGEEIGDLELPCHIADYGIIVPVGNRQKTSHLGKVSFPEMLPWHGLIGFQQGFQGSGYGYIMHDRVIKEPVFIQIDIIDIPEITVAHPARIALIVRNAGIVPEAEAKTSVKIRGILDG